MNVIKNSTINRSIMKKLMKILTKNPYVQFFWSLKDDQPLEDFCTVIRGNSKLDQRVYNVLTVDQVVDIWIKPNNPNIASNRGIIVHAPSGHRHNIKNHFGCYDPYNVLYCIQMAKLAHIKILRNIFTTAIMVIKSY